MEPTHTSAPVATGYSLPGAVDLLKQAYATFISNSKTFISLGLVVVIIGLLNSISVYSGFFVLVFIFAVLGIVFQVLLQLALVRTFVGLESGAVKKTTEIYKESMQYFWPMIFVYILTFLSIIGGTVLLFIPGLILSIFLMFTVYGLAVENKRGFAAITSGWYAGDGMWGTIFWRQIQIMLMIYLPLAILSGIIVGLTGINSSGVGEILWGTISGLVIACFIMPITLNYQYRLYKAARQQKPEASPEKISKKKTWLIVFMTIGIIAIVLMLILGITVVASIGAALIKDMFPAGQPLQLPANIIQFYR